VRGGTAGSRKKISTIEALMPRCVFTLTVLLLAVGCHRAETQRPEATVMPAESKPSVAGSQKLETATFGTGCFWCTEAVFQQLRGVESVTSGYSGGDVVNPTYEQVCDGSTGHAEVIQVKFDPAAISYDELLKVFWQTHDPTTPNQQGNDIGTQYRSAIFYHSDEQRRVAEAYKQQLDDSKTFSSAIVTEITPFKNFYAAEKYHQNYFNDNPYQGYCQFIVRPKVEKFQKQFKELLKDK